MRDMRTFTLYGGPKDGQEVELSTCTHGHWPAVRINLPDNTRALYIYKDGRYEFQPSGDHGKACND